jgi:hypothetical protein
MRIFDVVYAAEPLLGEPFAPEDVRSLLETRHAGR